MIKILIILQVLISAVFYDGASKATRSDLAEQAINHGYIDRYNDVDTIEVQIGFGFYGSYATDTIITKGGYTFKFKAADTTFTVSILLNCK